jgi:hypothetical protein
MRTIHKLNRAFLATLMFSSAYLITITVDANAQASTDAIQLQANSDTTLTGTIDEVQNNFLIVDTNGKKVKVVLNDVEMNAPAKTLFKKGMNVGVSGKVAGDAFGTMILDAKSVTASGGGPATYAPNSATTVQ